MALEFYNYIKSHAEKDPDRSAIIDGDSTVSYGQLVEQAERFAGGLDALTLGPQSKLGIFCANQKEYIVAYLGALLKGLPLVPFNFMLKADDLAFIARDAGIDTIVVDSMFVKPETVPFFQSFKNRILAGDADPASLGEGTIRFEEFLEQSDRGQASITHVKDKSIPSVILYTSGTTARPKGVMLNEEQFDANCDSFLKHVPFAPQDKVILALPLFHSFGNIITLVILRTGGTLIFLRQFAPKSILASITKYKATILPLVPTIYSFLIELYARGGYDVSSLRYCISGGAALPEALLRKVEETMGVTVIEGYGLTETSPVIAVNTFKDGSVPGSVGPVLPNVTVKIVDESGNEVKQGEVGEIWVRAKTVMLGYWNRPEQTREALTEDGWLKTGDLGHLDENHHLFISAGRKKDLIIRAGENVSPLAIENALMNHPGVAEVAAVGVPDERVGERVKVCVTLRQGATATDRELKELCRKKLPPFMIPDLIQFYDALPKNATGKILKSQLREE